MPQTATYWCASGATPDGAGGLDFSRVPPQLVRCRWQDKAVLFRSVDGQELTSSAIVYTDRRVEPRGYLALGDWTELMNDEGYVDPASACNAREIRQIDRSPNLRGTLVLNKVYL